ncbi:MAG: serpin family protein [Synergistaceae bacterium]|jgi:serpin B|nr:serpin family protein [Synergistaceae bacterium]
MIIHVFCENNLVWRSPFFAKFSLILTLLVCLSIFSADSLQAAENITPMTEDAAAFAVNSLAVDLYRAFAKDLGCENICFSPYSVSTTFAMTYAGAAGDTAAEMEKLLYYSDEIHESNAALLKGFAGAPEGSGQLSTANSIWPQRDYRLLNSFTRLLASAYEASARPLDYKNQPDRSRAEINDWVAKHTNDKIQDILPSGSVRSDTRLVLVNAVYFKAPWLDEFRETLNYESDFFASPDASAPAVMMRSVRYTPYFETDETQVLKLPYARGVYSMIIFLPKERDGLGAIEGKLALGGLDDLRNRVERRRVDVNIPKFRLESSFDLTETLKNLGVGSAFDEDLADFSLMNGKRNLYINVASHKAIVEVDERGTEAAAATAISAARATALLKEEEPVIFRADHPFIFLIQDEASGTILFMGRVSKP